MPLGVRNSIRVDDVSFEFTVGGTEENKVEAIVDADLGEIIMASLLSFRLMLISKSFNRVALLYSIVSMSEP